MTPVGQRSTHSAQRVHTSSSTTKNTLSFGSSPGFSVPTASSIEATGSMWMHFHGQMSTHPSQRMHSAWSMCRNCFGFTACVNHVGSTSCTVYALENSGIGGFASVRAMSAAHRHRTSVRGSSHSLRGLAFGRRARRAFFLRLRGRSLLPHGEEVHVHGEHEHVD